MSLTGKPPQDLCLTNLAVKDTLVATTTTALNVNATTINGLGTAVILEPIRSVFTGVELGQWSVSGGLSTVSILGQLNYSGAPIAAGTVFAQIENYIPQPSRSLGPVFVYCPEAATIATATFFTNLTLTETGQIFADTLLGNEEIGRKVVRWEND